MQHPPAQHTKHQSAPRRVPTPVLRRRWLRAPQVLPAPARASGRRESVKAHSRHVCGRQGRGCRPRNALFGDSCGLCSGGGLVHVDLDMYVPGRLCRPGIGMRFNRADDAGPDLVKVHLHELFLTVLERHAQQAIEGKSPSCRTGPGGICRTSPRDRKLTMGCLDPVKRLPRLTLTIMVIMVDRGTCSFRWFASVDGTEDLLYVTAEDIEKHFMRAWFRQQHYVDLGNASCNLSNR
jgi:hypothetical protein